MRNCDSCGGSIRFVNGRIAKCEYCGRLFQVNGDNLSEVNMESLYKEAIGLFNRGAEEDILNAIEIFDSLGSYKDSSNKVYEGKNKISKARADEADRKLEEQRQNELAEIERKKREYEEKQRKKIGTIIGTIVVAILAIAIVVVSVSNSKKNDNYQKAVAYFNNGEYENAVELFEKLGGYKDSADYLRSAHESITTRDDTYDKGVAYYNEGLYLEAINVLTGIAGYLDSNEYIEDAAGKLCEQGEQFFNGEEYEKARDVLGSIPETSGSYTKAVALLKQVDEKLVEIQNMQKYESAVSAYESEEYEKAQRIFIEIRGYSDSVEYLNKIGDSFFATAKDLFTSGDYVSCGDYLLLIDTADEWERYSETTDLFNQAKGIYYDQTAEEAKNICRSQGEAEMNSFVKGRKCSLLSDDSISALTQACTIEVSWLHEMNALVGDNEDFWYTSSDTDNMGNSYKYSVFCCAEGYSDEITYALDGKYKVLSGTLGLRQADNDNKNGIWIEFYGDGKLIGETVRFASGVRPSTFEIDVTGVSDLMIKTNSTSIHSSGFLLTDGFKVSE